MLYYLESFLEMFAVEKNAANNSLDAYKRDLVELLNYFKKNNLELKNIDSDHLRNFIKYLNKDLALSPRTIARKLSAIRQFFSFLYAENILLTNPSIMLDQPKYGINIPSVLSLEDINKVIDITYNENSYEDIRFRSMIEILYAAGLRISELISLKMSNLNYEKIIKDQEVTLLLNNYLMITGKGNKQRIVIINEEAKKSLEDYLIIREHFAVKNIDYLYPSSGSQGHMTRQNFGYLLKQYAIKAGLDPTLISPHKLRHSFASHMLEGGADLRVIQELLGHADINTTQIYTHIADKKLEKILNQKHPASEWNIKK